MTSDIRLPVGARPDLVIFDCDGVLVDSEPLTDGVIADNLRRHGVEIANEEVAALFTGGTMATVGDWARAQGAELPSTWTEEMYAEIFAVLTHTPPVPGALAVLDICAAAGLPMAIGSNGPHAKMAVSLAAAGIAGRIAPNAIHSAYDVDHPKPAPDLFLRAAAAARVSPARCAVVGDSLNDANAAREAGMRCYGFAAEGLAGRVSAAAFLDAAATPFAEMSELPALLGLSPDARAG